MSRSRVGGIFRQLPVILLLIQGAARAQPEASPVWPPPPETPRYTYAGSLSGELDVAKQEGLLGRLSRFIFGEQEKHWLIRPHGVAVAKDHTIVVADPGLPGVHIFHRNNKTYRLIQYYRRQQMLKHPVGVAITNDGNILVSDSEARKILMFSIAGKILRDFESASLQRPTAIAVHPRDGRVFVTDTIAHQVVIFSPQGKRITHFGKRGDGPGEFNYPTNLAFDKEGLLYVTDSMNFRVQVFVQGSKLEQGSKPVEPDDPVQPIRQFGQLGDRIGEFSRPKGIAIDSHGYIYVVESYFDHLLIFDTEGRFLLPIGGTGDKPGQFHLPAGVAVMNDLIYVADAYNRRIQIFRRIDPVQPDGPVQPVGPDNPIGKKERTQKIAK